MGSFGIFHWLIVLVILLLFFGPNRLPDLGRSLGKAIRGFKDGLNTEDAEATEIVEKPREQVSGGQAARTQESEHKEKKNV